MAVIAQGELDVKLSKASTSRLEGELTETARKAGAKAGTEGGKEFGNKFSGRLGGTLNSLTGKLKEFGKTGEASLKPMTLAQGGVTKLSGALESLGPAGRAGGLALGAIAAAAFKGIGHFVELAAQIRKFKAITGESAEKASVFVVGLNDLGVSSEGVARGLSRLARQSTDGKEPLKDLGVAIARTKDGNFDAIESFKNVADKIHDSTDAAYRNQLAFKAFGRAGIELIPILSRGGEALDEFQKIAKLRGEIFTDKDLKAARDYTVATRSLGEAFDALEIGLGKRLVPLATNVTLGLTQAIDQTTHGVNVALDRAGKFGKNILGAVAGAAIPPFGIVKFFNDIGASSDKSAASLGRLHVAEQKFAGSAKKDLDAVASASTGLAFTQGQLAKNFFFADNLSQFGEAASGAAVVLSTDLKTGVTDYAKALALLDPIAARVAQDQFNISVGLDPIAAQFDITAAAADEFARALSFSLTPFENVKGASFALTRQSEKLDETLKDNKHTLLDVQEGVLSYVQASGAYVDALVRDSEGALNAADAKRALLDQIDGEIRRRPALTNELSLYRQQIEQTPDSKLVDFKAQGLNSVQGSIDTLNDTLKELTKVFEIKFGIDPGNTYIEIDKIKRKFGEIPAGAFSYFDVIPQQRATGPKLPERAMGGDVWAGRAYWVGEKRPELFVPKENGTIIADPAKSMRSSSTATASTNITINEVHADPRATAFAVATALGREGTR